MEGRYDGIYDYKNSNLDYLSLPDFDVGVIPGTDKVHVGACSIHPLSDAQEVQHGERPYADTLPPQLYPHG